MTLFPRSLARSARRCFKLLQPVALANCELERFGEENDGGYILCGNLLGDVQSAYSYGISGYDGWGCEVSTQLKVRTHQYRLFRSPPAEAMPQRRHRVSPRMRRRQVLYRVWSDLRLDGGSVRQERRRPQAARRQDGHRGRGMGQSSARVRGDARVRSINSPSRCTTSTSLSSSRSCGG